MTIMYKLVTQRFTTRDSTKWELNKTNKATGKGNKMCTDGVLHCYKTPEQAVLFNPIHAEINDPILMKIDCSEILDTDGLKYCSKEQTPVQILNIPVFTMEQKVTFGIKCALLVCKDPAFVKWANDWLDGTDRDISFAWSVSNSTYGDDYIANYAANYAAYAAYSAGWNYKYATAAASAANVARYVSLKFESKEEFALELDKIIASL